MENTYFVWINSGVTSIGELIGDVSDVVTVKNPYMIVNMQYGIDKNGNTVPMNSPEVEKVKFKVDLYPYLFKEYLGGSNSQFKMKVDSVPYMVITDKDAPIVKQYSELVSQL